MMRDGTTRTGAPSPWVVRFIEEIRPSGRVLDVACGAGRHLRLGLERGRSMVGIDRDIGPARSIGDPPELELVEADLEDGEPFPFAAHSFDGVIVTNYLWRPILPDIVAAVGPNGVLIYETFAVGHERLGRPTNPDFLLRPGELMDAVTPGFDVLAYEQVRLVDPDRIVQRIAARRVSS